MTTAYLTIPVDSDAAQVYETAPPAIQEKVQMLLNMWLHALPNNDPQALKNMMDTISINAEARGLTPEILESILNNE